MSSIKNVSLFVPHVFPNFTKEYVAKVFEKFGPVDHVDFVLKQDRDEKEFNSAYIHFKYWNDTQENRNFQDNLFDQECRVYHDGPWYWIVLENKGKKHVSGDRKQRIDLGGVSAITPEKPNLEKVCPGAPIKSYAQAVKPLTTEWSDTQRQFMLNMEEAIEKTPIDIPYSISPEDIEVEKMYNEMDEIEAEIEIEDANLVSIDVRYLQTVEAENLWLRNEVAQLRAAVLNLDHLYQVEAAKVRALNIPQVVNVIPNDENV
jgi:hypothetical protein